MLDPIPFSGLSEQEQRIIWEWSCMALIVIGTEVALTWWPAVRRLRQRRQPRAAVV